MDVKFDFDELCALARLGLWEHAEFYNNQTDKSYMHIHYWGIHYFYESQGKKYSMLLNFSELDD